MTVASRLLLGLLLLPASVGAAQTTFPSDTAVRTLLQDRVRKGQASGVVVGLLNPDGSRSVVAFGDPGPGGLPLDGNSVFEIGSISKVFTTAILADMVRRGEVSLSDPVARYLPPEVRMPSKNGKEITLLDLATHYSGLPRLPTNFAPADNDNPYADYTVAQLYEFLSSYSLPRDPGARYEYSNLGGGLLGHVLARRAGISYEELVTRTVLGPLGMRETSIALTADQKRRMARGHNVFGQVVANWDLPTLAGAGALRSTVNDMLTFAAVNLATATDSLAADLRAARVPQRLIGGRDSVGLAWITSRIRGQTITWHNGGTGGYSTFLGLDVATNRAVVVLSNSNTGVDDLGFHLLEPGVPLTRAPVMGVIGRVYLTGGIAEAISRYRGLKANVPDEYSFDETQLNLTGYWLLQNQHIADAIEIFRLNVEMFPQAFNPYDSLGEAYLAHGDTALAITSYKRSVELNPGNTNGTAVLKRLGALP